MKIVKNETFAKPEKAVILKNVIMSKAKEQ